MEGKLLEGWEVIKALKEFKFNVGDKLRDNHGYSYEVCNDNEDYKELLYMRILGFKRKEEVGNSFFADKSKKFYLVK